jgi:hypothetical protein
MFIHFLNEQILRLHGLSNKYTPEVLGRMVERALLATTLVSEQAVIIPTVDVVQSPVVNHILPTLVRLARDGHVDLVGSTANIDELVVRKQVHYYGTGYHPEWAGVDPYLLLAPLAGALSIRHSDTTYDMFTLWNSDIGELALRKRGQHNDAASFGARQLAQAQYLLSSDVRRSAYLDAALELPHRLRDHAFLWHVVQQVNAFRYASQGTSQASFERALAYYWVLSHVREYGRSVISRDEHFGMIDCGLRYAHVDLTFDMVSFRIFLRKLGLERLVRSDVEEVCEYKRDPQMLLLISDILRPWFDALGKKGEDREGVVRSLRRLAPLTAHIAATQDSWGEARVRIVDILLQEHAVLGNGYVESPYLGTSRETTSEEVGMAERTVFIGHGRSPAWLALRDLLRDRLGLRWEEFSRVPVAGKTAIQRLGEMLDVADFALVVLTAEDEQVDGTVRARQNVVHELGLFQGRLGFDRAIALVEEGCDEFRNLAGLQQISFPRGNIMAVSEEIRRVLEDRLSGNVSAGG